MEKMKVINPPNSPALRKLLETCLSEIFSGIEMGSHLAISETTTTLHGLNCYAASNIAPETLKMAYNIWFYMDPTDRYAILDRFSKLSACYHPAAATEWKTLMFCAVFVSEFAAVLTEAATGSRI